MRLSFVASLSLAALLGLCAAGTAAAMPGMEAAQEKFAKMDADKDGKLSEAEFFAAYPKMQKAAFAAIDTDKDGFISDKEWNGFLLDHARGRAAMPADKGMPGSMPPAAASGEVPLVMPPAK